MHSVKHTFSISTTRQRSEQTNMVLKFIVLSSFFVLANAGNLITTHYTAPVAYAAPVTKIATPVAAPTVAKIAAPVLAKHAEDDYDPHPQYTYSYDVQDSLTGDNKQHLETRDGDNVRGSYSFIEADGSRRIVEYTADAVNGFDVVIHKVPADAPVAVAPAAKIAAAPLISKAPLPYAAAPLFKAAPLVHTAPLAYSSPLAKVATPIHA